MNGKSTCRGCRVCTAQDAAGAGPPALSLRVGSAAMSDRSSKELLYAGDSEKHRAVAISSIGVIATRSAITEPRSIRLHELMIFLAARGVVEAHHGVCIGGDVVFHEEARRLEMYIVGHPGVDNKWRKNGRAESISCDEWWPEKPFLERNKDIVKAVDLMIAMPAEMEERRRGSGTWFTIREARRQNKPLFIIWPDATYTNLGAPEPTPI
jgi:hypothetical protein